MLDLEYIKANTLWVIKHTGYRQTVKGSEVDKYRNEEDIRDIDIAWWKGQPEDLQEFYRAYEFALYNLDRRDLFFIDDFYKEWVKDPKQFTVEHKVPIDKFINAFENLNLKDDDDLIVNNYNKETAGNHRVKNWKNAIKIMGEECNFDVIEIGEKYGYHAIIVQTDNDDLFEEFSYLANKAACDDTRIY